MPEYAIVTAKENSTYGEMSGSVQSVSLPSFLDQDAVLKKYWSKLSAVFPKYQFCLQNQETQLPVARGHCIPLAYNDSWSSLPEEGFDWALEKGFSDHKAGREPTLLCALLILVADPQHGKGLSYKALQSIRSLGREHGFNHLVAPVRPSKKSRFPMIPIDQYCTWKNADGNLIDPWLRVHVRSRGRVIQPCSRSMVVTGSITQWSEWTEMDFPDDGEYIVHGALAPIRIRHEINEGVYVEPGVWVVHELGRS